MILVPQPILTAPRNIIIWHGHGCWAQEYHIINTQKHKKRLGLPERTQPELCSVFCSIPLYPAASHCIPLYTPYIPLYPAVFRCIPLYSVV